MTLRIQRILFPAILLIICLSFQANAQFRSDVFMQGFYWNSPPGGVWYDSLSKLAPKIASAGFGAVWFPSPVKGAGGGMSMGYDPYDHYDFGDYNQKGSVETRFGSRKELEHSIAAFHNLGVEVWADAVTNHMSGGEVKTKYQCKPYASYPDSEFLLYQYPNGSGRFKKDSSFFYPNALTCDVNPPYHGPSDPLFAFGQWLAKDQAKVRDSLIAWGKFLRQGLKFDGFRLDAVKSIDPAFMGAWLKAANGTSYAVAEYFGDQNEIISWQYQTQTQYGGKVAMFDFPLRYTLQSMCNNTSGGFDMTVLDGAGLINAGMSGYDVSTWVENHDVDRIGWDGSVDNGHNPVITNKEMAYAYIIFSEGRPCVFFKDYFDYGFGKKIDTLIWLRNRYLGGGTTKRGGLNAYYIRQDNNQDQAALSKDIYVARRNGYGTQIGGYLVINDNPSQWIDIWVDTELPIGTKYKEFTGKDAFKPVAGPSVSGGKNRVKLWAPPRSYTVYIADTVSSMNNAPAMMPVPDQTSYTNSKFSYQVLASDVNDTSLIYKLTGNPAWLSVSNKGLLSGTPLMGDTANSTVIITIADPAGLSAKDTFIVSVVKNFPPKLTAIRDTSVNATKRYELQVKAADPDNDMLIFGTSSAPAFLNLNALTGLLTGTPGVADTGAYAVRLFVTDRKGAYDSLAFMMQVKKAADSVILTFGKPLIDGTVSTGAGDWLAKWQVAADPDTDSKWNPRDTMNNEIIGMHATWDADSLYFGVHYVINDTYNTLMLYVDAGLPGGITNFNSNFGYNGDYAKNFRFRPSDAIDFFFAGYNQAQPVFFRIDSNTTTNLTTAIHGVRGKNGYDMEAAVAWNTLYGLGAGKVPPNVKVKFVGLVAGGFNYGAGDACPDNPDVDGNGGPDSLINLVSISPDKDGNGFPDPTVILDVKDVNTKSGIPGAYALMQNYPNPFNPVTVISYQLGKNSNVKLAVYDLLGREAARLVDREQNAGSYSVSFDASHLPSGIYFYTLQAGSFSAAGKMLLLK